MKQLVFATENPGKLREVSTFAANYDIEILSPTQAGLSVEKVEETGTSYQENARLKIEPYLGQGAASKLVICGDDSGMEIEALGGEPGIRTRRWKGYEMTDQEIIDYTLQRLRSETNRRVISRTVLAYTVRGGEAKYVSGELKGRIARHPFNVPGQEGFPFRQLFVVTGNTEVPMWKFDELSLEQRNGKLSHRESAFLKLFHALGWTK